MKCKNSHRITTMTHLHHTKTTTTTEEASSSTQSTTTTMGKTIINPDTGRKRKRPLCELDRRVRAKQRLTVYHASMLKEVNYRISHCFFLLRDLISIFVLLLAFTNTEFNMNGASFHYIYLSNMKNRLLQEAIIPTYLQHLFLRDLDRRIGDMSIQDEQRGNYKRPIRFVLIDDFIDDDEARGFTNFTKSELRRLDHLFELPLYNKIKSYKIHREQILIYFLIKNKSGAAHSSLCDGVTYGSSRRNYYGYRFMTKYLDHRYSDLIGPLGIEKWSPQLPIFAERIRAKIEQDRWWYDQNLQQYNLENGVYFAPNTFAIAGFVDCKDWKICRPGSGPNRQPYPHIGAQRRPDWDTKQRAFFGGHHRQHGVKTLALTLPNGMVACVFGPCSSRRHDLRILDWSEIDDILFQFQTNFLHLTPAELFAFYGDSAYFGPWRCIRRRHEPIGNIPLTVRQVAENTAMKKVRETIEQVFGTVTQYWGAGHEWWYSNKLDCSAEEVCSKLRVLHLLQNCLVCCRGGSSTSNTFGCNPPSLEEYLNM